MLERSKFFYFFRGRGKVCVYFIFLGNLFLWEIIGYDVVNKILYSCEVIDVKV